MKIRPVASSNRAISLQQTLVLILAGSFLVKTVYAYSRKSIIGPLTVLNLQCCNSPLLGTWAESNEFVHRYAVEFVCSWPVSQKKSRNRKKREGGKEGKKGMSTATRSKGAGAHITETYDHETLNKKS
jgi:hypothetical protein